MVDTSDPRRGPDGTYRSTVDDDVVRETVELMFTKLPNRKEPGFTTSAVCVVAEKVHDQDYSRTAVRERLEGMVEDGELEKWQPHDRATIWYRWSVLGDVAEQVEGNTDTEDT